MDFASVQLDNVFIQFIPAQIVLIPERNEVEHERIVLVNKQNVLVLERIDLIHDQNVLIAAQNGLVPEWKTVIPR